MKVTEAEYQALLARNTGRLPRVDCQDIPPHPAALAARALKILSVIGDQQIPASFDVTLTLPFPPSVNDAMVYGNRGRMTARKVIWAYRSEVCRTVATQWPPSVFRPLNQRLQLHIVVYRQTHRRFDLDNRLKVLWDSLSTDRRYSTRPRAAVYLDDSQIDHFSVTRGPVDRQSIPYVTVRIASWM